MPYPSAADIKSYGTALGAFGDISSSNLDTVLAVVAPAIEADFERRVGWGPFLQTSDVATTRFFDPPSAYHRNNQGSGRWHDGGKYLIVGSGLRDIEEVKYHVDPENPTTTGVVLDPSDYWLYPENSPERNLVSTGVRFGWVIQGAPRSIAITGVYGFTLELPADLTFDLIQYGMSLVASSVLTKFAHNPAEWQEGDVRERFNSDAYQKMIKPGLQAFNKAVMKYRYVAM